MEEQKKELASDTQSRKWQLTVNNPENHGYDHETIIKHLENFKSILYWCMSDEIGENGTFHTHIYIQFKSSVRFSKIKKEFKCAHIECANGTAQQNKDYIRKEGKWEKDKKKETNIAESFEEFGELPIERQGKRNDLDALYDMINSGMSNAEIIQADKLIKQLEELENELYSQIAEKIKED